MKTRLYTIAFLLIVLFGFGEFVNADYTTSDFSQPVTQNIQMASGATFTISTLGTPSGTFLAADPTGKVIATTTPSSGSGITAITGPTGLTFAGTPTSVGTLASGFSIKELPSWTVCSSGCDFTTIQGALNQASSTNGTNGGGTINVLDGTFAQGSTGLLIKSPNTWINCNASTTITFTGATTLFKTSDPAFQFSNVKISGCIITGDNTTGGVAINTSDMSHSYYTGNTISTVDSCFSASDTQNVTFYNRIADNNCTFKSFGLNASSTNAWNANIVDGNFLGGQTANAIGVQVTNANGDTITNNRIETAAVNTTIDIYMFDNNIATCNGIFNNTISGNYLESGKATNSTTGIRFGASLCSSTKIYNNQISNNIVENHAFDYIFSATTTQIGLQNWFGNIDSNFGNPLNSFAMSLGIGTSSELQNLSNALMPALAVSASSTNNSYDALFEHTGNGGADVTDALLTTGGVTTAQLWYICESNQ